MLCALFDSLAPEPCVSCGLADAWGAFALCPRCESGIARGVRPLVLPDPLRAGWALGPYEGTLGAVVRAAKYGPRPALLATLGTRLGRALCNEGSAWDAVTWVPSPLIRRIGRGFDPAELIARAVAQQVRRPAISALRRRDASPQAARSDRARRVAIRGAYEAIGTHRNTRFLLVDDVITTGATLATCADVLVCAAARSVDALGVAARDL